MTVSDNVKKSEGLGSFFKTLGKISAKTGKKLATNILKNPGRALKIGANVVSQLQVESLKMYYQY